MTSILRTNSERTNQIAEKAFNLQFDLNPEMAETYTERQRRLMYEDILYNLSYLDVAVKFDDAKIFTDYTIWLYQLLCNLSDNDEKDKVRTHQRLKQHFQILIQIYTESIEDSKSAISMIEKGIEGLDQELNLPRNKEERLEDKYHEIRKEYLNHLIRSDTRSAINLVINLQKANIPIDDIFQNILQEVMEEVGDLWYQNEMSVDKEHYCTSTTQTALSQFYPIIFDRPYNGCKIVTCCVGSELHEMGIRMLSDLFEYHGWDSIYLGASVPKNAILHSIAENKPDLVGLSVTMPQHLELCLEIVEGIKEKYPEIKVAVGGRAFNFTNELWKKWNVDISTQNATQLIEWANRNIVLMKGLR